MQLEPVRSLLRPVVHKLRGPPSVSVAEALERGRVISRTVDGKDIRWIISNRGDEIQTAQARYGFYELKELQQLARDVGPVETVLDVGANIGNHSVFFATFMGAKRLVGIEPFPGAAEHWLANLALNCSNLESTTLHRCALGAEHGRLSLIPPSEFNIGLTKLDRSKPGDTLVMRGDDLDLDTVDLVKIDVEGFEISVLHGLMETLRRCSPAIYIETTSATRRPVEDLLAALSYELVREVEAYGTQHNLTFTRAS